MAALASPPPRLIRSQPSCEEQVGARSGGRDRPAPMPTDITLPSLDVRALARRAALPAALVAAAVLVLVVAHGPLQAFADALRRAASADPRWVAAGAAFEAASFAGYVLLLWLVGGRATRRREAA